MESGRNIFHPEGIRFYAFFLIGLLLTVSTWSMYQDKGLLRTLIVGGIFSAGLFWAAMTTKRKVILGDDQLVIRHWLWPSITVPYKAIQSVEMGTDIVEGDGGSIAVEGIRLHLIEGKEVGFDRVREGTTEFFDALQEAAPHLDFRDTIRPAAIDDDEFAIQDDSNEVPAAAKPKEYDVGRKDSQRKTRAKEVVQAEPPARSDAIRVSFELTPELAKESLNATPAAWRRRSRVEFWVCSLGGLLMASLLLVPQGLIGPLVVGWVLSVAITLLVVIRFRKSRRDDDGSFDPIQQQLAIDADGLAIGHDHSWVRHHWAAVDGISHTRRFVLASLIRGSQLLGLPKSAFPSDADAEQFSDAMCKFRDSAVNVAEGNQDRSVHRYLDADPPPLMEFAYPATDPIKRTTAVAGLCITAAVTGMMIWLSKTVEASQYIAGPLAFLFLVWMISDAIGIVIRRIGCRRIPQPGIEHVAMTASGVHSSNALREHFNPWSIVSGANDDGTGVIRIWNQFGHELHAIPLTACRDSNGPAGLLEIIDQYAAGLSTLSEVEESDVNKPDKNACDAEEAASLEREFGGRSFIAQAGLVLLYVAFLLGLGFAWTQGLDSVAKSIQSDPDTVHQVTLSIGYWALVSIPLALTCGCLIVIPLYRFIRGKAMQRELKQAYIVQGQDLWGQMVLALVVCVAAIAVMVPPGLDCYVRVTSDGMGVNGYWWIGETHHSFDQVKSIRDQSFDHHGREIPAYQITFTDGSTWSSQGWIKDVNPTQTAKHRDIVEYVSQRSGVEIR